jgi:hypothetical protein
MLQSSVSCSHNLPICSYSQQYQQSPIHSILFLYSRFIFYFFPCINRTFMWSLPSRFPCKFWSHFIHFHACYTPNPSHHWIASTYWVYLQIYLQSCWEPTRIDPTDLGWVLGYISTKKKPIMLWRVKQGPECLLKKNSRVLALYEIECI